MPACDFHPGVETSVRCVECDRYICPKDFVPTPVGYKCRECGRQAPSARRSVKPKQLALSIVAAALVGIGGAFAVATLGFSSWLGAALLGALTGEAARRASGGHREGAVAAAAGLSVLVGTFIAGFSLLATAIGTGVAVVYVMSNRW